MWLVVDCEHREGDLRFSNGSLIRFGRFANVDIVHLVETLNRIKFPIQFAEGIVEFYFTRLPKLGGYYLNNKVRISCELEQHRLESVFLHEIGHHVDERLRLSDRNSIALEHSLDSGRREVNITEYVAVGFERYYLGDRAAMRKNNPKLYNVLRWLHRKSKV